MMKYLLFSTLAFWGLFSFANNCKEIEKPFVVGVTKSLRVIADPRQEVVFDGKDHLPKVLFIESVGQKDRPRLTVLSGLQVLENGKMVSYPYRVSLRLPEDEQRGAPKLIQAIIAPQKESKKQKTLALQIDYTAYKEDSCTTPQIGAYKKP